jgi:hypothetical protein
MKQAGNEYNSSNAVRRFDELRIALNPLRQVLVNHPIYSSVNSVSRLREFMQMHAFAVWDFMSLVKRLHSNSLPWLPPVSARIARFTNEVVLGEETDVSLDGKPISHFELYLRAMDEIGADTSVIKGFAAQLALGANWRDALAEPGCTRSPPLREPDIELRDSWLRGRSGSVFLLRSRRRNPGYVRAAAQVVEQRQGRGPVLCLLPGTAYRARRRQPRSVGPGDVDEPGRTAR